MRTKPIRRPTFDGPPQARFVACWLTVLCLELLLSSRAHASDTPYQLHPVLDPATMVVSATVWWVPALFPASFVAADGCRCNAASLNALDRPFAGTYSAGFSVAGEILIASAYVSVLSLDLFDALDSASPGSGFLTDIAVIAEAVLLNGALNELVKLAVRRPRPLLYGHAPTDPQLRDRDNYVSFYSAHTSSAFALGLAYAQTFAYRHPDSPYRWLVYAGALAAGSVIGATRIAAGKHFPSDVLVGALAGAALGWSIPWIHQRSHAQLSVMATPNSLGLLLAIDEL